MEIIREIETTPEIEKEISQVCKFLASGEFAFLGGMEVEEGDDEEDPYAVVWNIKGRVTCKYRCYWSSVNDNYVSDENNVWEITVSKLKSADVAN